MITHIIGTCQTFVRFSHSCFGPPSTATKHLHPRLHRPQRCAIVAVSSAPPHRPDLTVRCFVVGQVHCPMSNHSRPDPTTTNKRLDVPLIEAEMKPPPPTSPAIKPLRSLSGEPLGTAEPADNGSPAEPEAQALRRAARSRPSRTQAARRRLPWPRVSWLTNDTTLLPSSV